MLKLQKIAITGGVASGKSAVCRIFQELGAFVVNADAIVHDLLDPNTDRFVVVAAGIARGGTVAAGEFLVDAHHLDELALKASKDWSRKNVEVVLETQVIDGRSGPPRIDEVYTW